MTRVGQIRGHAEPIKRVAPRRFDGTRDGPGGASSTIYRRAPALILSPTQRVLYLWIHESFVKEGRGERP